MIFFNQRKKTQNLKMKTKLPYKTQRGAIRGKVWTLQCLISSLYNALVHHHVQYWICIFQVISQSANFLLTKHFGQSIFIFWQSIFIFWQRICTFQVISQSANFLLTKSRAQARPDLSTTYFDLDDSRFSLFANYHISSYLFRHELQNKIILDESGYFAFEPQYGTELEESISDKFIGWGMSPRDNIRQHRYKQNFKLETFPVKLESLQGML